MQDHNQHSSGTMIETAPTAAPYGSDLDDEMSSRCSSPDSSHLQPVKFNVPVLIETPCTPEPPDFVASANNEVSCEEMPNSFVDASEEPIAAEHTLSRRRKPKKRSNMSLPSAEDIGMFEQLTSMNLFGLIGIGSFLFDLIEIYFAFFIHSGRQQ